jgi:DNA-directed RNA polymerase specialized sigma24 family protein
MRHSANAISELSPDRYLVRAALAGDRVAYGELYQRYAPMVHGVLLARVAPDYVDDLLQEVFLKAMTQITHLQEDDHFGGWIAAISRKSRYRPLPRNTKRFNPQRILAAASPRGEHQAAKLRLGSPSQRSSHFRMPTVKPWRRGSLKG